MNYPLLSEYITSLCLAEENFAELSYLRPVLQPDGRPFFSSGNFAAVFKMKDESTGRLYAVKCFIRDQVGREESYRHIAEELEFVSSSFLTPIKYLEKELFVCSQNSTETEFPVLLMDWVEGETLDAYIRAHIHDIYALEMLSYQFGRLAAWLMAQPFAHGDLKPDNILVKEDGSLVLVDYDGMYVPAMKGQKARELGSPDYSHPLRTSEDFNEHIDEFSLASIALSLKAVSLNPDLLQRMGVTDGLLFAASDYRDLSKCEVLKELHSLQGDGELNKLLGVFLVACAQGKLSNVSFRLFELGRPKHRVEELLSTEVTEEDLENCWEDEFGVKYSKDRKRLLVDNGRPPMGDRLTDYKVIEGTKVICSGAFGFNYFDNKLEYYERDDISYYVWICQPLKRIELPESIISIGSFAFSECVSLQSIHLPKSLTNIENNAFLGCSSLQSIQLPESVTNIGNTAFRGCSSLQSIHLPESLTNIENNAFWGCSSLQSIHLPESLTSIGYYAFAYCSSLQSIQLPESLTNIGDGAFRDCSSLQSIHSPESLTSIGDDAFENCHSLQSIHLPESLTSIGDRAFSKCSSLQSIHLPELVTNIGISAFSECSSLQSIHLPESLTSIGYAAFWGCSSLQSIQLPESLTSIGDGAFRDCSSLQSIHLPESLISIGDWAFSNCSSLQSIHLPESLTSIGHVAFAGCRSLQNIHLPESLTSIGDYAFEECSSLQSIHLPKSITDIANSAFDECPSLQIISIPSGTLSKFQSLLPSYLHSKLCEI